MGVNTEEKRKKSDFVSVFSIFHYRRFNGSLQSFGSGGIMTSIQYGSNMANIIYKN